MAKIVHFFQKDIFINSFMKFIKRNYEVKDHTFVYWQLNNKINNVDYDLFNNFNTQLISTVNIFSLNKVLNLHKNSDIIIFHSLYFPPSLMIYFTFNRNMLYKAVWVIYGGDVSNYVGKLDFKRRIWSIFRNRIIKKIRFVVAMNCDYKLLCDNFKINPKRIDAYYPYLAEQIAIAPSCRNDDSVIRILLGNYASPKNHHIKMLNYLSKFKDENILIYIPLSYGDEEYAKSVIKIGTELFNNKIIPLTKFIDRQEYGIILSNIDIGIFDDYRQQAMGTIMSLLISGAKIFVNPDGCIREILNDNFGIKTNSTSEMLDIDFEEFISFSLQMKDGKKQKIISIINDENLKKQWDTIFNIKV